MGSTKYFKSWNGYKIPFVPADEVTKEIALGLKSYYIGVYRENVLFSFEKILDSQHEWIDEYEYWEHSKKIKRRVLKKNDGSVTVENFDKSGKMILP